MVSRLALPITVVDEQGDGKDLDQHCYRCGLLARLAAPASWLLKAKELYFLMGDNGVSLLRFMSAVLSEISNDWKTEPSNLSTNARLTARSTQY